jgi:peptide/nickel transport system permease protein
MSSGYETRVSSGYETVLPAGVARPAVPADHGSVWRLVARRFLEHPLAKWWAGAFLLMVVACYGVPIWRLLAPGLIQSPTEFNPLQADQPPSFAHPFGTDSLNGHDIFSLVLYGGRISLLIGVGSMIVAMSLAIALGSTAAFVGGWCDSLLMRMVDVAMSLPILLVLPVITKVLGYTSPLSLTVILGLLTWPGPCRIFRSVALSLREQQFVEAARAVGVRPGRIMYRHLLPNMVGPILVAFTLGVGANILREAFVSWLGFGLQPPQYSWGTIMSGAQQYMLAGNWWWITFPGLALVFTVLSINFIGDGLRDAFDPKVYR